MHGTSCCWRHRHAVPLLSPVRSHWGADRLDTPLCGRAWTGGARRLLPACLSDPLSGSGAPQGTYVVLFFYPLDFTFVCPTEITAFSDAHKKFADINTEVRRFARPCCCRS